LQFEVARRHASRFSALITTPCHVRSRWTYPLPYYCVFAADTLPYVLTFDLWPWTYAVYRLWCDETPYQISTQSSNPRRSYSDFNIWPNDLERHVTCCARLWDNFHEVRPSTTYLCLDYSGFYADMLCHAVTLTFNPLMLKVRVAPSVTWSNSVRNLSEIEQSPAELLIILRIFAHVMSRFNLDLWPLDLELLQHFGCHALKLCTKFERSWIIHRWVIDDLARFRCAILDVRHDWPTVLRSAYNFTKLGTGIGRSFLQK